VLIVADLLVVVFRKESKLLNHLQQAALMVLACEIRPMQETQLQMTFPLDRDSQQLEQSRSDTLDAKASRHAALAATSRRKATYPKRQTRSSPKTRASPPTTKQ
jgi:hypothetical protein